MKDDDATLAGQLVEDKARVAKLLADIDTAIKEGWDTVSVRVTAPGKSQIDLFPDGKGAVEIAHLILTTTQARYQVELASIAQQLEAL